MVRPTSAHGVSGPHTAGLAGNSGLTLAFYSLFLLSAAAGLWTCCRGRAQIAERKADEPGGFEAEHAAEGVSESRPRRTRSRDKGGGGHDAAPFHGSLGLFGQEAD